MARMQHDVEPPPPPLDTASHAAELSSARSGAGPKSCSWADHITALGLGLVAGVILHASQNARALVKRIPQSWLEWNKDNEELTSLILVVLCVVYSMPRLWFFLRQNRKTEPAPNEHEEEGALQQESCSSPPARSGGSCDRKISVAARDGNDNVNQSPPNAADRTASQPHAASASSSRAPVARDTPSPRTFSDVNEFIKAPTMTSNGLAPRGAGVPPKHSPTPPPPLPPALSALSSAGETCPIARRVYPQQQQQQARQPSNGFQALPSRALHAIIGHLPFHSRVILARASTSLNATVIGAAADVWHHTEVDISIVDGRLLKRVLQRVGVHVRALTFMQDLQSKASGAGLNRLGDGDVAAAIAQCPQLTELNCSFAGCCSDIELFKAANARCCPDLRVLNLRYCSRVTDIGLIAAVRRFTALQVVRCSGNQAVSDAFLHELSQCCPGLIELDCSNTCVSSSGISLVLQRCLRLQKLYIAHCPLVSDSAFFAPSSVHHSIDNGDEPVSFISLLMWPLFGAAVVEGVALLVDVSVPRSILCAAVCGCVLFASLWSRSRKPSSRGKADVWRPIRYKLPAKQNLPGSELTSVDLSGLVNLSQMGLSMLIKRCGSSLKHFVMESPKISEKCLQESFRACPNLEVLLLEGCNVNDATVQVLAQNCMLLREVSIKGSLGCSDKSADVLLQPRYFVTLAAELPATTQIGHAWVQCHYEGRSKAGELGQATERRCFQVLNKHAAFLNAPCAMRSVEVDWTEFSDNYTRDFPQPSHYCTFTAEWNVFMNAR